MKRKFLVVIIFLVFFLFPHMVFAEYVLPYPSYMPGNKLYTLSRSVDVVKKYWYWGSLAQIKYHLALSDKYLVEAKILFEYKQYLLAVDALNRSDIEFRLLDEFIVRAQNENKDVSLALSTKAEAGKAHREILKKLLDIVPLSFEWTPEKEVSVQLALAQAITTSIKFRE